MDAVERLMIRDRRRHNVHHLTDDAHFDSFDRIVHVK